MHDQLEIVVYEKNSFDVVRPFDKLGVKPAFMADDENVKSFEST